MKKIITPLVVATSCSLFAQIPASSPSSNPHLQPISPVSVSPWGAPPLAPPPPPTQSSHPELFQSFSAQLLELMQIYAPRFDEPEATRYTPLDLKKHVNEEYRPAWEELYFFYLTNSAAFHTYRLGLNPLRALRTIDSVDSITALEEFYKLVSQTNNFNPDIHGQILQFLLNYKKLESLDAVLSLLDFTDTQPDPEFSLKTREYIMKLTSSPRSEFRKRFTEHQPGKLSVKNKELLETIRKMEPEEPAPQQRVEEK